MHIYSTLYPYTESKTHETAAKTWWVNKKMREE